MGMVRVSDSSTRWCIIGCELTLALLTVGAVSAVSAEANLPSEQNGAIAFQRNNDAHGEIWVIDPAAPSPELTAIRVTSDGSPEARPAWGPKFHQEDTAPYLPSHLAFQRFENGDWNIWDRPITDQGAFAAAVPLVGGPGNQVEPVYSDAITPLVDVAASGTALLAYVDIDQGGRRELWLRDGAGNRTQLTFDGAGYANPDFGGKFQFRETADTEFVNLVFQANRGARQGLWTMEIVVNTETGALVSHENPPRLIASGPEELSEPSWQATNPAQPPLGRVRDVLFTTRESGDTYLDYIEEPLTAEPPFADPSQVMRRQLTGDPGGDDRAVWAPFGDQIAFTRTAGGNPDLWVMAADGRALRALTSYAGPDLNPSWEPAAESSADVVGGHTEPGPVTRTPTRDGNGGNGGNNGNGGVNGRTQARRSPRLAIRRVRWHGRRVAVSGRASRRLSARVRLRFSCGRRRSQHTARRVRASAGRFGGRLTAPRACRRARRGTVSAAFGGNARYRKQSVSRRVRRR
jgi:hypothetical protein